MSKAVKKVFKKVKKAVKKVGGFVKKYWKEIVLVAAVVFTAGAALGYVGMGAGGGLVFGAGAGVGGMTGVTTAYAALGNTVVGAMGMQGSFGGTMTAKSAAVQGLGTGGMATSSAGMTANVVGGNAAVQSANAAKMAAAGVTPTAGSATLPSVAAAGVPQAAATTAPLQSGVGSAAMSSVAPAATTVPGTAVPLAQGAKTAALTAGETMLLGSVAMTGYDQYQQGVAADEAQKEAEAREAAQWDWNYGEARPYEEGSIGGISEIGYQPSKGLLQRRQEQQSTLDDVAAERYA